MRVYRCCSQVFKCCAHAYDTCLCVCRHWFGTPRGCERNGQEGMFTYLAVIVGSAMLATWIGLVSMITPVIGSAHDEVILNRVSYRAEAETLVILKQLMHNPALYPTQTQLTLRDTDREKIILVYNKDLVTPVPSGTAVSSEVEPERQSYIQVTYIDGPTKATVVGSVYFKWVDDASGTRKMKITRMILH